MHVPLTFSAVPSGHTHMKPHSVFTHTSVELHIICPFIAAIKHLSISDNIQNNKSTD